MLHSPRIAVPKLALKMTSTETESITQNRLRRFHFYQQDCSKTFSDRIVFSRPSFAGDTSPCPVGGGTSSGIRKGANG
jgi:hypothetical protein